MIRVLVVDDHAVVRSGLRLLIDAEVDLETVGEAGDVRGAIFEARSTTPDLILLDVTMPGESGLAGIPTPGPVRSVFRQAVLDSSQLSDVMDVLDDIIEAAGSVAIRFRVVL